LLVFSDVSCAWHETIKSCYPRKSYPRCVNSLLVLTPWNHQCQNVQSAQPNDQLSLPQSAAQSVFFFTISGEHLVGDFDVSLGICTIDVQPSACWIRLVASWLAFC
jgi:hypothetical protein